MCHNGLYARPTVVRLQWLDMVQRLTLDKEETFLMLSRTCPNNVKHFLHISQKYCKECGSDSVIRDHYTCQYCGWNTWNPQESAHCPHCDAAVFEPMLAVAEHRLA